MWKKILVSGAVGAAILGAGGTALAASGSSNPTPKPGAASSGSSTHSGHAKVKGKAGVELRRALHGTWVTKGKNGTFVTHDAIRGIVQPSTSPTASPTSITVKAADGTTETFLVNGSTKVRVKGDKTAATPGAVKVGDAVGVLGTGTLSSTGSGLTATHIVDRGTPTAKTSPNS